MATEQTELTTEQTELIEKLNCLEFETSQLNRAYQLWRSYVEKGKTPDWMTAAIRITYHDLIDAIPEQPAIQQGQEQEERLRQLWAKALVYDTTKGPSPELSPITEPDCSRPEMPVAIAPPSTGDATSEQPAIQLGQEQAERLRQLWAKALVYDTTAEPSPELSPMTESDWSGPGMPIATSTPSTGDAISEQPAIQQGQHEEERLRHLWAKALVYDTTTEPSSELSPITEPDWSRPEMPVAISPLSTGDATLEQPAIELGQEKCNCRECARAQEEKEAGGEISGILGEESMTAEPSPELLPMTEPEPDWSGAEMPVAISPLSTGDAISEQPATQLGQQEDEAGAEAVAIRIPATLANWLQGASTSRLFRAASVAIVMVAGFAIGIYLAIPQHAVPKRVQNSAAHAATGALAIPTSERTEFKFDPDPVVAPLGKSFVLSAVLSRGSDIASMAVQIDYDASLLQFKGVSEGGFLVKDGQQVVLTQRDDPSTGVLRISAEESQGKPGISGDGAVFALSFQARKRGKATVSIVPGAHDSQGRRIEMAGSQVSVRVN